MALIEEVEELREALKEMRGLASVCLEGDPWFAENAGLDTDAIFDRARRALGEES